MNSTHSERHLDDAELLRYLDEGLAADEAPRWQRHIERCGPCGKAVRSLGDDSRIVTEWLDRAAFEVDEPTDRPATDTADDTADRARTGTAGPLGLRRRPQFTPWLRAAAILVLLAAPLAAFPGVRTWVAERVTGPAVESDATGTPGMAPGMAPDESTVVRFVPSPGEFVVRFEAGTPGTITIARSGDATAALQSTGGEPDVTISPTGLRIRNADPGRYTLRLPRTTTGAWVMVGERAVAVSDSQIDRRTVVELR